MLMSVVLINRLQGRFGRSGGSSCHGKPCARLADLGLGLKGTPFWLGFKGSQKKAERLFFSNVYACL